MLSPTTALGWPSCQHFHAVAMTGDGSLFRRTDDGDTGIARRALSS
jgi:hypothetical protein